MRVQRSSPGIHNSIVSCTKRTRGPFLKSPCDFPGPKSNIPVKMQRLKARVLTNKRTYFVLLTVSSIMLSGKLFELTTTDFGATVFIYYYSFKIIPRFCLAKSTSLIHHNQLLMTKFGRILTLTRLRHR